MATKVSERIAYLYNGCETERDAEIYRIAKTVESGECTDGVVMCALVDLLQAITNDIGHEIDICECEVIEAFEEYCETVQ